MSERRALPLVLCILDGWGSRDDGVGNATYEAHPRTLESLFQTYPSTVLRAAGGAVGLPAGQIGNSEVGHLTIGAGRPIKQILTRCLEDVESGALAANPAVTAALEAAAEGSGTLHLIGLLSEGGVHSHQILAEELIRAAARFRSRSGKAVLSTYVHAFLDGRDTPPQSAPRYLERLQKVCDQAGAGSVASITGRFFAMDRDGNWGRTERAWRALVLGQGHTASDWHTGIQDAYARGETDEFVEPTLIRPEGRGPRDAAIAEGDSVVFFNFRADRARQMTRALAFHDFGEFARPERPRLSRYTCFTPYERAWDLPAVYVPDVPDRTLGSIVSDAGLAQYRVAETEKYAHVTYFLNGGREETYDREERILIPSRKMKSYAELPEMQAESITQAVEDLLSREREAAVVVNFANADMVGHSGDLGATIRACRFVDSCVARLVRRIGEVDGAMIVTADHGNAEVMIDPDTGGPHTAHTTNPVPCILVWEEARGTRLPREGGLRDITPTILEMLRLDEAPCQSGTSLLSSRAR